MVIQRSWKILSDAAPTSAASADVNRSPAGLHTSSDDSNCSNQTSHSMVTSAASPMANKPNEILPNPITSAEANNKKFVTTPQMAEATLQRLRQRLGGPLGAGNAMNAESAMRSLELLRISVQQAFDKEANEIIKRFMDIYFNPAYRNIKENLGQHAVSEDTLQKMSCALLENAKAQYNTIRPRNQMPQLAAATAEEQSIRVAIKRPAVMKPVYEVANKVFAIAAVPTTQTEASLQPVPTLIRTHPPALVQQRPQAAININNKAATTVVVATSNPAAPSVGVQAVPPIRRQIFWNTAIISTSTKFVLDVQANMAFGFGTDGKERLASKHPELIRYLPDSPDREWLSEQNIILQENKNSRFLFLIYDEVTQLQRTHELYRNKPGIDLSLMMTFTVSESMIQKMKLFFVDLNIKSRGLITNSFSIGNSPQSNSHLRNALLQGMQAELANSSIGVQNASAPASTSGSVGVQANFVNCVQPSDSSGSAGGGVQSTIKPKIITSTLSSSHATLTALLNNSSAASGNGNNTLNTTEKPNNLRITLSSSNR